MRRASDAVHGLSLAAILGGLVFMAVALMADDAPLIWACGGSIALGIAGVLLVIVGPDIDSGPVGRCWRRLLAACRLDLDLVCELSAGLPEDGDYHDYPDSAVGQPWHMYSHTCRRCGKRFTI